MDCPGRGTLPGHPINFLFSSCQRASCKPPLPSEQHEGVHLSPTSAALWRPRLLPLTDSSIDNLSLQVKQRGCIWLPWKHRKLSCFHCSLSFFSSNLLAKWHSVQYLCTSLSAANRWDNLTSVNNYFAGGQEHSLAHWALVAVQDQKQKQQELFYSVKSSDLTHRGNLLGKTTWFNIPNFLSITSLKTQKKKKAGLSLSGTEEKEKEMSH